MDSMSIIVVCLLVGNLLMQLTIIKRIRCMAIKQTELGAELAKRNTLLDKILAEVTKLKAAFEALKTQLENAEISQEAQNQLDAMDEGFAKLDAVNPDEPPLPPTEPPTEPPPPTT